MTSAWLNEITMDTEFSCQKCLLDSVDLIRQFSSNSWHKALGGTEPSNACRKYLLVAFFEVSSSLLLWIS